MPRRTIEQQMAHLEAKLVALQARRSKMERTRDTRRKVLLGAALLHSLETAIDAEFQGSIADWLRRKLPVFLTRDADKELLADLIGPPIARAPNLVQHAPAERAA
jgi:hypothetical protein